MTHFRFENVCVESFGYVLPEESWSSSEIEERLAPAYNRMRLPPGRLELMTGISRRRVWRRGTLPSDTSIESGRYALDAAGVDPSKVGALIHASVCRDHLEPATACRVHHELGLPADSMIFDLSNACLGVLNGMALIGNMIELGQIKAGLVVSSEGSRQLLETTIDSLNRDENWTRQTVKLAVASLTIGSASVAVLLTHRSISQTQNRLLGGVSYANTVHHKLCHSGRDEAAADGMHPLMTTDSERLMAEGIATGAAAFTKFKSCLNSPTDSFDRVFCHQVGSAHRKLMLESLNIAPDRDFTTLEYLGNTGSAALPVTMAIGAEKGRIQTGHRVAMLGIGSGINSIMLGVDWNCSKVKGVDRLQGTEAATA